MEYLLLLYSDDKAFDAMPKNVQAEALMAYGAYTEALVKAGAMRNANRLRPTQSASTVRVQGGKTEVLDGPYIETREELGGYYLIDVPDLDSALAWAARCPCASHGSVEVRPVWPMDEY